MGRPLKKSFFGSPATGGKQLVLSYVWLEDSEEAETGFWIVRQVGTARYQVTNGSRTGVVKLVDAMPDAPGEGVIEVHPFEGAVEYAAKIHNRTVVTFDGNTYKWSVESASEEGQADFIFETGVEEDEEEEGWLLTAEAFEGGVGFGWGEIGSLNPDDIEGIQIRGFYEDNIGHFVIMGDHQDDIESVEITIGDTTITYGYAGQEGATEYLSEDSFGFEDGEEYVITSIVFNAPVP